MCNAGVPTRHSKSALRANLDTESIKSGVQKRRLCWYGHVICMSEDGCVRQCQIWCTKETTPLVLSCNTYGWEQQCEEVSNFGVQKTQLRWYGHVTRVDGFSCVSKCHNLTVEGNWGRGKTWNIWYEVVKHDTAPPTEHWTSQRHWKET